MRPLLLLLAVALLAGCGHRGAAVGGFYPVDVKAIGSTPKLTPRTVFTVEETPALLVSGSPYWGTTIFVEVGRDGLTIDVSPYYDVPQEDFWVTMGKLPVGGYHATLFVNGKAADTTRFAVVR